MRSTKKFGMLAGASVAALGLALAAAPATAFDEVDWEWNSDVDTNIDFDIKYKAIGFDWDLDFDNVAQIEDLQVHVGDVSATSRVTDVYNDQYDQGTELGNVELDFTLNGDTNKWWGILKSTDTTIDINSASEFQIFDEEGNEVEDTDITLSCSVYGCSGADGETYTVLIDLEGQMVPMDAYIAMEDLPEVVSSATAVANNASLDFDFGDTGGALMVHEGQFAFDVDDHNYLGWWTPQLDALEDPDEGANTNLALTEFGINGAILGILDHSEITATSRVNDIDNASVDSSATAVANNFSADIQSQTANLVVGDITQFSLANVSSVSSVNDVKLNSYSGLGEVDVNPVVNSAATAVGNNKSITVNVGDIDPTE